MQIIGLLLLGLVLVSESISARTVLMDNPSGLGDESIGPAVMPVPPLPLNYAAAAGASDMISPPGGYSMDNSDSRSLLDSTQGALWTPILLRKIIQQIHRQQQELQQQQQYPNSKRSKNFYQQCAFNAVSCFG